MEELDSLRENYDFPPELDFCSDSFDPVEALKSYIHLPYPNAKTYNNLAEYYSHTFLKKGSLKRFEKDRPYDRDYSYYYATLGIDRKAQERYERRRLNRLKRMKYAGWRTAKLRKKLPKLDDDPNRELCRGYPPLQSTKIIQVKSSLRKYKIFPIANTSDDPNEASNFDNQLNDFVESETKDDKNSSAQCVKKLNNTSTPRVEMDPQTFGQCSSSGVKKFDDSLSKNSRYPKMTNENSSYSTERKQQNLYQQPGSSKQYRQSRNLHLRKDLSPENRDPRLKKRKRYT